MPYTGTASAPSNTVAAVPGSNLGTSSTDVLLGGGGAKEVICTDTTNSQSLKLSLKEGSADVPVTGMRITSVHGKNSVTITGVDLRISSVHVSGTTASSALTLVGTLPVSGVVVDGSINSITAKSSFVGDVNVSGTIAKVAVQGLGSLTIGGAGRATSILTRDGGSNVSTPGVLAVIKGSGWDGSINAAAVGQIKLTSSGEFDVTAGRLGTLSAYELFDSTITLTQGGVSLSKLSAFNLTLTTINTAGSIGTVHVGQMWSCQIFAGVKSLAPSQRLPDTASDFEALAFIGTFKLFHTNFPSFVDSLVAASLIRSINLADVTTLSTRVLGVSAERISSLRLLDDASNKELNLRNVDNPATLAVQLAKFGTPLQEFVVQIVS